MTFAKRPSGFRRLVFKRPPTFAPALRQSLNNRFGRVRYVTQQALAPLVEILKGIGMPALSDMDEAVQQVVKLVREAA